MVQDALRHRHLGDERDELKPAAAGTGEDVHGEDLPEEVGPRDAAGGFPVALPGVEEEEESSAEVAANEGDSRGWGTTRARALALGVNTPW